LSRRTRWLLRLGVLLSTVAPYIVAWLRTPPGDVFLWIYPPYPEDMLSYLAWSRQAQAGHILLSLKYTAVPHAPFFFNPFFLLAGWTGFVTHLDLGCVHLLLKTGGVLLFVIVLERFLDSLGLTRNAWIAAACFVSFASGFGAFMPSVQSSDLWMPEISTQWSLLWNPLYPYSLALTVFALHRMHRAAVTTSIREAAIAGLAVGFLAIVHPYHVPVVVAIAAADALMERRAAAGRILLVFFTSIAPFAIYPIWVNATVDVAREHAASGTMASPAPWSYAVGLGLPLVFAIVAIAGREARRFSLLVLWAAFSLAAAYVPVWFARKLVFSAQIPVAILGGVGFALLLERASRPLRALMVAVVAIVVVVTPVRVMIGAQREIARAAFDNPFTVSEDRLAAMRFLRTMPAESLVFADLATMRLVPALAGNRVPFGHWAQSVDARAAVDWTNSIFGPHGGSVDERRARFWSRIDFVLLDGPLLSLARRHRLDWLFGGRPVVFENQSAVVLRRGD